MWNNKPETSGQSQPPTPEPRTAPLPPGVTQNIRSVAPVVHESATLGSTLTIKGEIHGSEDLQINGSVDGPISLNGHRLTVGPSARLTSEVTAREAVVYGKVSGNLRARDRVEIKKDGVVTGDIMTSRISIEDGAYFKGHIEIERTKPQTHAEPETEKIPVGATTD
jgi:cytoskeletal protein CcmA (bactofilin family)